MRGEPESHIVVSSSGNKFYFIEDTFCSLCGKVGIWRRQETNETYGYEEGFCICIKCQSSMRIIDVTPIVFNHKQNEIIFNDLWDMERKMEKTKGLNSNSIDCLEALTV